MTLPREYTVFWANGESDPVLAVSRPDARDIARRIWAGSTTKTEIVRVEAKHPTLAERIADEATEDEDWCARRSAAADDGW